MVTKSFSNHFYDQKTHFSNHFEHKYMNNNQIKALIKTGESIRKPVGGGLYIRVQTKNSAKWEVRYSINGKRKFIALEGGQYPQMPLVVANAEAAKIKMLAKKGIDPMIERKRKHQTVINTVDDLFEDWYQDLVKRLKHPQIPKRIYTKEVKPQIGSLFISDINARDIRSIIHKVAQSGRPSTANDTLMYLKQLFNHACKLDLKDGNPASAFKVVDAGGVEASRDRALTLTEVGGFFSTIRKHSDIFTRDNYIAMGLLVCLGIRKGELIAAKWQEFDFKKQLWNIPQERSKTSVAITIPLPEQVIPWFEELYVRSCGSEYIFPSRRASKRRGYISDDTLNHALAKIFGQKVDSNLAPYPNHLAKASIDYFRVHDLRRTCRSLLSEIGIQGHIAERCLNHKLKGVEGIYNRYDYLDERRDALNKLAFLIAPIVNGDSNVTPFIKKQIA